MNCFQVLFDLRRYNSELRTVISVGRELQVEPMKPVFKPPGLCACNWNMIICLQVLLANSTCAASHRLDACGVRVLC